MLADLVSGVDLYFGGELINSFGARYRGGITASKTGYFRFWITAPDETGYGDGYGDGRFVRILTAA